MIILSRRLSFSILLLVFLLLCRSVGGAGFADQVAAQAAIDRAQPGDEIVLEAGKYANWELTIRRSGTAELPITLRPETPGTAVFSSSSHIVISGDHVLIQDLVFEEPSPPPRHSVIRFDGAAHSRVTRTAFRHARVASGSEVISVAGVATDCRVDHCQFIDTHYRSVRIIVGDSSLKDGPPVRTRIDHNLFRDVPPLGRNGGETIQIGSRAYPYHDLETFAVVEDNVFIHCDGEAEIISDKTSENTFRRNVFLDCRGELVIRHGNRSTISDNRFVGCSGGIRLSGAGHIVTGNTIVNSKGTGIRLYYGVEDAEHPAAYLPVTDCLIQGNTIINARKAGLMIGAIRNQRWHSEVWTRKPFNASADLAATLAPARNRITQNTIIGQPEQWIVIDKAPDNEISNNLLIESEPANAN